MLHCFFIFFQLFITLSQLPSLISPFCEILFDLFKVQNGIVVLMKLHMQPSQSVKRLFSTFIVLCNVLFVVLDGHQVSSFHAKVIDVSDLVIGHGKVRINFDNVFKQSQCFLTISAINIRNSKIKICGLIKGTYFDSFLEKFSFFMNAKSADE